VRPDSSQRITVALRSIVLVGLLLCGGGCDALRHNDRVDLDKVLTAEERTAFETFADALRRAYEQGNDPAVEAMIEQRGMPPFVAGATRLRYVPKGPSRVVDQYVKPLRLNDDFEVMLGGVKYGLNVEPLGVLVFEIDDVSIGRRRAELVVGKSDGVFRLAGLEPVE